MIGQMRQSVFSDTQLSLFQQAINDQFSQIANIPFINGNWIQGVSLTSGQTNSVNHKLQRTAQGYFITSKNANAVIWNDAFSGTTAIGLHCSANCTVDVWVF